MVWTVVVTPAAQAERQRAGLGQQFLAAARAPLDELAAEPRRHPCVLGEIRRVRLKRFPYALFYRLAGDTVAVTACLHQRRSPARRDPSP